MQYPGIDITEADTAKEVWSHINERYFRTMLEALMKCAKFHGMVFDRYLPGATPTNELFTDMVRDVSIARISYLNPLYTDDDIYRQVEKDSRDGYAQKWVKDLLDGLSAQNIRLRYADSSLDAFSRTLDRAMLSTLMGPEEQE